MSELVSRSALKSGTKGKLEILEATPAFASAPEGVVAGSTVLADPKLTAAVGPLTRELQQCVFDADRPGCVLVRNVHVSILAPCLAALGAAVSTPVAVQGAGLVPLGTDAPHPGAGVDAVAVASHIPSPTAGQLRLASDNVAAPHSLLLKDHCLGPSRIYVIE